MAPPGGEPEYLLDQYVGSFADNRYTLGTQFIAPSYPIAPNHTLTISDVARIVHAAASFSGNGFGNYYHVFLPQGVDMCLPVPRECGPHVIPRTTPPRLSSARFTEPFSSATWVK